MKPLPVRVVLPNPIPNEGTVVEIDGQDITGQLRAFTLHAAVGEITTLTLELGLLGKVEIEGVALVESDQPLCECGHATAAHFGSGFGVRCSEVDDSVICDCDRLRPLER